jgi:hypothetical protein
MRDRLLIFAGLLAFIGLFTFPIWHAATAKTTAKGPELQLPIGQSHCVAPRNYMRTSHMKLLMSWRDGLVRHQQREFTAYDGQVYRVSLTNTCLGQCHQIQSKAEFCDRCHAYAAVAKPYCWDCHQSVVSAGGVR